MIRFILALPLIAVIMLVLFTVACTFVLLGIIPGLRPRLMIWADDVGAAGLALVKALGGR